MGVLLFHLCPKVVLSGETYNIHEAAVGHSNEEVYTRYHSADGLQRTHRQESHLWPATPGGCRFATWLGSSRDRGLASFPSTCTRQNQSGNADDEHTVTTPTVFRSKHRLVGEPQTVAGENAAAKQQCLPVAPLGEWLASRVEEFSAFDWW